MRLAGRVGKLEASAPPEDRYQGGRFALVRGPLSDAESLPAQFGLIASEPCPVIVTEIGWMGGAPELVSPLLSLSEMEDEPLHFLASIHLPEAGGVELPERTVIVSCVVGERD